MKQFNLQQEASNPKNSAWVFASAGSGKTKILTDRVLRLLLEDVSPGKILCLTFTKVAAAEMQQRINAELSEWILCSDEKLTEKLANMIGRNPTTLELKKSRTLFVKILDDESKIKAQTIHSFCQSLIKICPFEAGVSPAFEIIEKEREGLFLQQAKKEVLKKALKNTELGNLIKKINTQLNEESFSQLIGKMLGFKEQINLLKQDFFGIENLIDEIFKAFSLSKSQTESEIFLEFLTKLDHAKASKALPKLESGTSKINIEVASKIKKFISQPTLAGFENYKSAFFTEKNDARKIHGAAAQDHEVVGFLEESREIILNFSDEINSLKIAQNTAALLKIVDAILANYSLLKKQNALLDYNDLIVETNRMLSNPDYMDWVKLKMDGSFDHILIDESQDTNHQQWNIIKALSEDFFSGESASNKSRSIFIVGDEKQSIYGFQGADPNISRDIFGFFKNRLGDNLKKIELNNSFRSAKKILQAVDEVFADEKRSAAISKISPFSTHKAIRETVGKVEIWPQLQKPKAEKKEKNYEWQIDFEKEKTPSEAEILAEIIARKIKFRVESNDAKYGDFMILLRTRTNGFDKALVKYFHQYQIPFTSVSNVKFSDNLLIQDLLSAAKFVNLPQDDLNLANLLKSPIFEILEDDLLEICLRKNAEESCIYKALEGLPKFSQLKNDLDQLITKSKTLNCFEFFYFLLNEKNRQQKFIAEFGLESLTLMDNFLLSVGDFSQNFSPHLQLFLDFVEKINPTISLSSEANNHVRISTIHSAKGLQAPIVMIPDCAYNLYQLPSFKEEILWVDFEEAKIPLWCRKKSEENKIVQNQRQIKSKEAEDEYLRLLYVAMTRAENELYIGGFGNSKDQKSWYEIIKNSVLCAEFISEEEFLKPIELSAPYHSEQSEISQETDLKTSLKLPRTSQQNQIDKSQIKGRLIHKILEVIGKNYTEEKPWLTKLAERIIEKENFLNLKEKTKIHHEISQFLTSKEFEKLFCGNVRCEVEVFGECEDKKTLNRIDLLVERENEILVIDYKSDETLPNQVPQSYLEQLTNYQRLVQKIYPNHKIVMGIFWTKFLQLKMLN
jgi:ATP-dependent helicase/nuclease subunit A